MELIHIPMPPGELLDKITSLEIKSERMDDEEKQARSVYYTNDRRAADKKELNVHLGSAIVEEKSYQDYT